MTDWLLILVLGERLDWDDDGVIGLPDQSGITAALSTWLGKSCANDSVAP